MTHIRTLIAAAMIALLAKAGKGLTLVRCENSKQTAFIRFEFGS